MQFNAIQHSHSPSSNPTSSHLTLHLHTCTHNNEVWLTLIYMSSAHGKNSSVFTSNLLQPHYTTSFHRHTHPHTESRQITYIIENPVLVITHICFNILIHESVYRFIFFFFSTQPYLDPRSVCINGPVINTAHLQNAMTMTCARTQYSKDFVPTVATYHQNLICFIFQQCYSLHTQKMKM